MTDIMIVRNRQLFAHTYLDRLLLDASHDTEALALTRQIAAWAPCWDTTSPQCALDTIVLTTLDTLEFGHSQDSEDARCHLLYADATAVSPLGTLYAAPPGANLDDTTVGSHWMFLAVHAARRHQRRWALLTNGLTWRLLDADHQIPYEVYLELDLGVLRDGRQVPAELARALWSYLRRDAWLPGDEGKSGLDAQDEASRAATQALEEHLRGQIESVLGNICRGFIDGDGRSSYTDRDRRAIFDSATVAIYRMLFTLYAEARGLLPTDHPGYSEQSMRTLVNRAVALQRDLANPQGTSLWEGLKRLWGWIDRGNPEIGVAPYNGGLFSNDRDDDLGHDLRVLRSQTISDAHLSRALVDLATLSEGDARLLIDYRDLSVRHLGTLYEGILDHKLFIVEEPTLARQTKKGVQYLLAKGATQLKTDRLLEVGEVYFAQAPDERKATGSFYTPEYIVDYIVRHTVRTGLDERWQAFVPSLRGMAPEERGPALAAFIERQVLTFRVCDPAMGSGHFLVNAAHTITAFIVETLNAAGAGEGGPDSDPTRWRRRVVGSCLYGVDINPLAVELAKLSLWLATVERGRPLSFLDHHLRCGNSLIGARLEELPVSGAPLPPAGKRGAQVPQGQLSFYDIPAVRASMQKAASGTLALEADPEDSPDDVHGKATRYQALRGALIRRYGLIADLAVARRLGVALDEETLQRLVRGYLDAPEAYVPRLAQRVVEAAQTTCAAQRTFHWELEFPQAFSGLSDGPGKPRGGFQAVVGNPPYVRQESLGNAKQFFEDHYEVYHGSADLYAYFVERGVELLAPDGHFAYVVSNKWMRAGYGKPLRQWLKQKRIAELVDFGSLPVFGKVSAYPCILRVDGGTPAESFSAATVDTLAFQDLAAKVRSLSFLVDQVPLDDGGWALVDRATRDLLEKLRHTGIPLEEYVQGRIYRGIVTGLNEAFVIDGAMRQRLLDEDPKSAELIRPWLEGRDIGRYRIDWPHKHVIYVPWDVDIGRYTAIYGHLRRFEAMLSQRGEVQAGRYPWYAMSRYAANYVGEFSKSKVVWPNMCSGTRFALDTIGCFVCAPANLLRLSSESLHVLSILNSSVVEWLMRHLAAERGGGFLEYKPVYVREVSIPVDRDDASVRALTNGALALISRSADGQGSRIRMGLPTSVDCELDRLVYSLYGLSPREIDIIEAATTG